MLVKIQKMHEIRVVYLFKMYKANVIYSFFLWLYDDRAEAIPAFTFSQICLDGSIRRLP
jgi:hypothetical protein